ncbi:MAG: hypothetical protein HY698_18215 [Deltaproteobacteria bacterium]|nr:hypothetical protein [Deltaproteobacteria bacterium]
MSLDRRSNKGIRPSALVAALALALLFGGCSPAGEISGHASDAGHLGRADAARDAEVPRTDAGVADASWDAGGGPVDAGGGEKDCYADDKWTCVSVSPAGPYGKRTFQVPAAQNWVNTGLYLRAGQKATIAESGTWNIGGDAGESIDHGPCVVGDFVARIGLHYKDKALTCISGQGTFTADKDGILYVGALPSNDLGETYETRRNATGAKNVTVTSTGDTAPTVASGAVAQYDFGKVTSGWVELAGEHVLVTLPTRTAKADQAILLAALERLDAIYELHEKLRGARPQHGQRLRFFPDGTQPGYMLAGNPVRMASSLVEVSSEDRISNAGAPPERAQVWGFAHELGHDFTFVHGAWNYQDRSLESWPNIFSVHALEALGIPPVDNVTGCPSAKGSYNTWDAWGGLCFLLQFQYAYGWKFYADFFRELNTLSPSQVPGGRPQWHFVHDLFEKTSGKDVTPVFRTWEVPNPG